jgi:hypothetical protein
MNHVSVHEDDAEIVEHLRACGVDAEFRLPHWRKGRCANLVIDPTFRTVGDAGMPASVQHRSPFTTRLRQLDVLENKHIPARYLRASHIQRLELVRGLMDSDGTISPDGKRCEFSNTDSRLVEGLAELLHGLGYKSSVYWARSRRRVIGGQDDCLGYWRVSWTAYAEEPMFRLSRKKRVADPRTQASEDTMTMMRFKGHRQIARASWPGRGGRHRADLPEPPRRNRGRASGGFRLAGGGGGDRHGQAMTPERSGDVL